MNFIREFFSKFIPDLDPDPTKSFGSNRIRIHNTENKGGEVYPWTFTSSQIQMGKILFLYKELSALASPRAYVWDDIMEV
jgi:hypothetical protein